MNRYRKTVIAVVGAGLAWSGIVIDSARATISAGEWRMGAVLLATALGVYAVSNETAA